MKAIIEEIRMQSTFPDLWGNHVHMCPQCFDDVPCNDWCTWNGEDVTNQGVPTLHPVICDSCREILEQYQSQGSGI